MKPSENAVEILLLGEKEYPEGLYAWVDYDTEEKYHMRLKWVCEDEKWTAFLNMTLSHLTPVSSLSHYDCDHPNPPLEAAKYAAECFNIKILSKGITRKTGLPKGSLDFDDGHE